MQQDNIENEIDNFLGINNNNINGRVEHMDIDAEQNRNRIAGADQQQNQIAINQQQHQLAIHLQQGEDGNVQVDGLLAGADNVQNQLAVRQQQAADGNIRDDVLALLVGDGNQQQNQVAPRLQQVEDGNGRVDGNHDGQQNQPLPHVRQVNQHHQNRLPQLANVIQGQQGIQHGNRPRQGQYGQQAAGGALQAMNINNNFNVARGQAANEGNLNLLNNMQENALGLQLLHNANVNQGTRGRMVNRNRNARHNHPYDSNAARIRKRNYNNLAQLMMCMAKQCTYNYNDNEDENDPNGVQ